MSLINPFETLSQADPQPSLKPLPYSESVEGKFLTPVNGRGLAPQFQLFGILSTKRLQEQNEININRREIFLSIF
jgi:hypothetical protein